MIPRDHSVSALLVGDYQQDRDLLHKIFGHAGWRLFEARSRCRAMQCLERNHVQVVIAEASVPNWNWKTLLHDLHGLERPPQLVVTSPQADDYLWSEALNLGAYDVLSRPFDRDEVERVVASAGRHFDFEPMPPSRPLPLSAAGAA